MIAKSFLLLFRKKEGLASFASEARRLFFFEKKNQKTFTFGVVGLLMGATPAVAQSAPIAALDQALLTAMKNGSAAFPSRYQALAPAVDEAFNLQQILKTIVGLRWSSIPPDQQAKLLSVFRAYTIANYAANFNSDSGDQIRILPETRSVGADRVVETEIVPKSGDPTRIDYVMRQFPAGWQAIDVLEEGTISQAAVQRSDFRSLLADGAGQLIDKLQGKVDTLSGGTIKP
jgi:phospholipid transport system substrate-binding protein